MTITEITYRSSLIETKGTYKVKTIFTADSAHGQTAQDLFDFVSSHAKKIQAAGGKFGKIKKITLGDRRWATSCSTGWTMSVFYPVADQDAAEKIRNDEMAGLYATYRSRPAHREALRALIG